MAAAALRRHAVGLQQALARLSSTVSGAQKQQRVIPAEVAQLVSLRGGMTALPPDVAAAVDQAAADSNRKAVKRRGQELSYRLRHMSRSKHRGGMQPNLTEQLAAAAEAEAGGGGEGAAAAATRRQQRGKRRQSRHQALEQLTKSPALPVGNLPRRADLDQLWGPAMRGAVSAEEAAQAASERQTVAARSSITSKEGGSLYDQPAALAYAASRMPACYAAAQHVLGEVAQRMPPGWRPVTMLDFGAGPATAVWAAQQVWRQQPLDALAVEPAGAMSWLGNEIQQGQRQQYEAAVQRQQEAQQEQAQRRQQQAQQQAQQEQAQSDASSSFAASLAAAIDADGSSGQEESEDEEEITELPAPPPRLRWMYKLPPRYRTAQARPYDLVTAAYVLGEIRSDVERRRLIEQLWERTCGVLVLLEPGTPSGAAHIQRARTQLLELGAKERVQQQQQQQLGGSSGSTGGAAAQAGAHVVAPCPHDGACPLEGRQSWCHFVQRFQRTALQRAAKASAGIQPRTYQDERFSYVAVARGPRPAAHDRHRQPLVAGSFMPSMEDPQDFLHLPANLTARKVPEDARPLLMYSDSDADRGDDDEGEDGGGDDDQGEDAELDRWAMADEEEYDEGELVEQLEEDGGQEGSGDEDSSSSSSSDEEGSDSSSEDSSSSSSSDSEGEEEEASAGFSSSRGQRQQHLRRRAVPVNAGAGAVADELAGLDEATRQLLMESVLDAADDDDGKEGVGGPGLAERLRRELLVAAAEQRQAAPAPAAAKPARRRPPPVLAPVSESTADLLFGGQSVDWEQQEPEAMAAARAASGAWSRLIRTPRKRSGHVVLDLCSAAPACGSSQRAASPGRGVLLRQVVSRAAARREAGGTAAYRLARSLRWGDLWPQHYQGSFRSDPALGG